MLPFFHPLFRQLMSQILLEKYNFLSLKIMLVSLKYENLGVPHKSLNLLDI